MIPARVHTAVAIRSGLTRPEKITPLSRDIVRIIAEDIAADVASHIETMYPDAVVATSLNMLRSVRGTVINNIMAAIQRTDETEILAQIERNRKHRREMRAAWRKNRSMPEQP